MLAAVAPAICLIVLAPLASIFALPGPAWAMLCIGYGLVLGARENDACAAAAGIAAMAMQAGWSFGFFRGLTAELYQRREPITTEAKYSSPAPNQIIK